MESSATADIKTDATQVEEGNKRGFKAFYREGHQRDSERTY